MFSDHKGIKLEINNKDHWKIPKSMEVKHLSKKHIHQRRSLKRNFKIFELNKMKTQLRKICVSNKSRAVLQ